MKKLFSYLIIVFLMPGIAFAGNDLPSGHEAVAGNPVYSIQEGGRTATLTSAEVASISNWRGGFDIGAGHTVNVNLPANGVHLSRDISQDPSQIFGALNVPQGQFFLSNPSGILFGPGSQVNAPGLVAAAMNIQDSDFLSRNYQFGGEGGYVLQQGVIQAGEYVALLGHAVKNEGSIVADGGEAILAAGDSATLSFDEAGLVSVRVDSPVDAAVYDFSGTRVADAISNSGVIQANGGVAVLSARAVETVMDNAVNHSGVIEARSVDVVNGVVTLEGHEGVTRVSGVIDASGTDAGETGGTVHVLGDKVGLSGTARIDVSGESGGGTILIGGDFQGKNPEIQNSARTYVGSGASINADAVTSGNGGKVIVWADDITRYFGNISARGGADSGNGGLAEVSGYQNLAFEGQVDLSASNGLSGTLLLDPSTITFQDTGSNDAQLGSGDGTILVGDGGGSAFTISDEAIEQVLGNISIFASGDITFNQALDLINQGAGDTVLFDSGGNIYLTEDITVYGASFTLDAVVDINMANGSGDFMTMNGGLLTLTAGGIINGHQDGVGDIFLNSGAQLTITANGIGSSSRLEVNMTNAGGTQTLDLTSANDIDMEIFNNNFDAITISHGSVAQPVDIELPGGDEIHMANHVADTIKLTSVILNTQAAKPTFEYDQTSASTSVRIEGLALTNAGSNSITAINDIIVINNAVTMSGGGDLSLTAGLGINGQNDSTGDINITASDLTLTADSIGASSHLDVDVTNGAGTQTLDITTTSTVDVDMEVLNQNFDVIAINASSPSSNIDIAMPGGDVIDVNGGTDATLNSIILTNADAAFTFSLSAAADILIGSVLGDAAVTISASNGSINETGAGDGAVDITGTTLTLTAKDEIGGAGELDIETTVSSLDVSSTTAGDIWITETDAVTLTDLDTANGNISILAGFGGETLTVTDVSAAGNVSLTAASGDMVVSNGGQANDIQATGTIDLTASGDDKKITISSGADVESTGGIHTYTADKMDIAGTITATGRTVILRPNEASEAVNIGSATNAAADTLELSDTELDNVTATTLIVGRTTAGALTVTSATSPAGTATLHLITGSTVAQTAAIAETNLAVEAGGAVTLTNSANEVTGLAIDTPSGNIAYTDATGFAVTTVDSITGVDTDSGSVALTATTGDMSIVNTAAANDVDATTTIALTASGDDAKITINTIADVESTGGAHTYIADKMDIAGTITATGRTVALKPNEASEAINLGSATDAAADTLELSDTELDSITDTTLVIGRSNTGVISVSSAIGPNSSGTLHLVTGSSISQSAAITNPSLAVEAGGAVTLTHAANDAANLAIHTTSGNIQYFDATGLTVGTVDSIVGVDTDSGSVALTSTSADLIVNNDINATTDISLTASGDDFKITISGGDDVESIGGLHTYTADKMNILGTVTATGQKVILRPDQASESINLGSATDAAADTLEISDAELDSITADSITIGRTNSSGIVIGSAINAANTSTIRLIGNNITQSAAFGETNLAAETAGAITLTNVANDVGTLALYTSTGSIQYTDANAFTVGTVDSVTGVDTDAGNVTLIATTGDMTLGVVNASGTATLTTSGSGADILDGDGGTSVNVNGGIINFNTTGTTADVGTPSEFIEVVTATLNTAGVGGTAYICQNGTNCDTDTSQEQNSGLLIEDGKVVGGDNFTQFQTESTEAASEGDDASESDEEDEEDGDSTEVFSASDATPAADPVEPSEADPAGVPPLSPTTLNPC